MREAPASARLALCPDCGGILHPTKTERLTSAEVAQADDGAEAAGLEYQCLICGYTDVRPVESED
jgi:hypothetical protein